MSLLRKLYEFLNPKFQNISLEYPVHFKGRYGHGKAPHKRLFNIIDAERETYKACIKEIVSFKEQFHKIKPHAQDETSIEPHWKNDFIPGLDIMALYTILSQAQPKKYIEIGSGHSTKVAYKAKREQNLDTKIISIDPFPRAEIDEIADEIIRTPFENIEAGFFKDLPKGCIVFVDNSHRVLPNSDAMVFFMEILPELPSGTIVQIHDIYLPEDYPQFMCDRFYSEQYMLAAFIMSKPERYKPLFPCWFVHKDPELSNSLKSVWNHEHMTDTERHGGSFWLEIA